MENSIWCLFSIENNYDQPRNNLVCAWYVKPDMKTFSKAFGIPDGIDKLSVYEAVEKYGDLLKIITNIHNGEECRLHTADYRFEEIEIGKPLKQD